MFKSPELAPRDTLYFKQWKYSVHANLTDASFLRVLKHESIDESIGYRNEWIKMYQRSYGIISAPVQKNLHAACDYLLARKHPYKKVVSSSWLSVYTNDLDDFEDFGTVPGVRVLGVAQADIVFAPDAVTLKNPQHAFRTYFHDRWLSDTELANLRRYFKSRADLFRLGPGFSRVITGSRMWLMNNHFVDHNEPNADLLISMAVPGIVRKTLPIIARAK